MNNTNNNYISRGCMCAPNSQKKQSGAYIHSCAKLDTYNWLNKIKPVENKEATEVVEVRFKNSRKDFFSAPVELCLQEGDIVAIEASPGHEIGIVTLIGETVKLQIKSKNFQVDKNELKRVYRRAKVSDVEKWVSAINAEEATMSESRKIASSLGLSMKISDVEYQGDMTKAIFYYTAEDRVDFRELIKKFADTFNVRIEMRQIGMRQEAARLGGIGSCGRELCCSTWLTNFRSVSTSAARTQQLSLNPQKLAGQCSKLKCCINFENDCYLDYKKHLPDNQIVLETKKGKAIHKKADTLNRKVYYAYEDSPEELMLISSERAWEIISNNKNGKVPEDLEEEKLPDDSEKNKDVDITSLQEESLERFDKSNKSRKRRRKKKKNSKNEN